MASLIVSSEIVIKPQLRGVNRSGAEYSCIKNLGIFEGRVDEASIESIKSWHVNVVRIPLNEECWLGIGNPYPKYYGKYYIDGVVSYVNALRKKSISVILDLHWSHGKYTGPASTCGVESALCQKPMPNTKYSIDFWKSVANTFKHDDTIIFELFNEPFPDFVYTGDDAWKCLRDGKLACSKFEFEAVGMQDLVTAIRSTGASNPIMVGGVDFSNNLDKWLKYIPKDPKNKIVASWHSYALGKCNSVNCWDKVIAPIAKRYSVIVGEMGETDCSHTYIDKLMPWMDGKGVSYVGWAWNTWGCGSGPALITNYDGTPTGFGVGLRDHLKK